MKKPPRPPVDWNRAAAAVREQYPAAKERFDAFLRDNPTYAGECQIESFPPRISVTLYLPATDKRRKSTGADAGGRLFGGNLFGCQVFKPKPDEVDAMATVVGQLADLARLRPLRTSEKGDPVYSVDLRPNYQDFAAARAA